LIIEELERLGITEKINRYKQWNNKK
jgi:hypothetical protein